MKTTIAFALAFTVAFTGIVSNHAEAAKARPDLIVSAVSAPSPASPDATVVVSGTIKNQGKASSKAFGVAYYLSTNPSSTTGAAMLGTGNVSSLAAGASVALVTSFTVPSSTTSGTFYVVAVADSTRVISESNESNNNGASGAVAVQDSTPPSISAVTTSSITANNATIAWATNEVGTSQVEYGTTATYGNSTSLNSSLVTSHGAGLSGLTAGTLYHFRVRSKDAAGNEALSGDNTFTTSNNATAGNAYYVATTGSDANPGSDALPFRTLSHGVSVLTPGDTLYILSGTYAEALLDNIPPGTSWSTPVTVAAAPGHTVTLKPDLGSGWVLHFQGLQQYIVIDGLILDGTNVTEDVVKITTGGGTGLAAHHIRLIHCEVRNAPGQGVLVTQFADWNEFIALNVHDNGLTGYDHGLYISTSHNVVEGSAIYHNSGYGVHIYNGYAGQRADGNIVRNNSISGNGHVEGGAGIILSSGDGNTAYNNLVWNNNYGIKVAYGAPSNTEVYNNTVYGNSSYGLYVHGDSRHAIIRNNLFYVNGRTEIQNYGVGTVLDHNLVGTDPQFVNAAAGDFHLQPDSPAIDTGISVEVITTDRDGTRRPQGLSYDIGALEFANSSP